jgi:hypothetical protein
VAQYRLEVRYILEGLEGVVTKGGSARLEAATATVA